MARIRIHGETAETLELGSFEVTIGRRPDNTIVLNYKSVSARHAVIRFADGAYQVEDLRSSNGTRVNGKRILRTTLEDGDRIGIADRILSFEHAPAPQIPAPPPRPTTEAVESDGEADLLDELVDSIRSHRERERLEREQARAQLLVEWDKLLALAEQLKAKIGTDPRVKYFGIDRKANDVLIRVQRSPSSPQQVITLARAHPDHPQQMSDGLWLIRKGEHDRCLPTAQQVGAELIRELAFLLA